MKRGHRESLSIWQKNKQEKFSIPLLHKKQDNAGATNLELREDMDVEVCIIGAGIAGLTTAYLLAREGKEVIILDAWGLAAGETGRTTAHLTAVLDDRFFELESFFGEDKTKLAADSHKTAIDLIEVIVEREKINCDFKRVDGYLVALNEEQKKDFDKEIAAVKRAGFSDMEVIKQVPVRNIQMEHAMYFPRQATFNALDYMLGLEAAFKKSGGKIYSPVHVKKVEGGEKAYAETDEGLKVRAQHIVVATNTPINDLVKMHTKQAAYRTYVIAYQVPKDSYSGFLLWDMEKPYHYVRILSGEKYDTLIVGGEDHKVGQANDMQLRYQKLDAWTRRYFTVLGDVICQWSGQIMEPVDCLAFIGHNPLDKNNVYIVTGDSGNGLTHGTIAGILISDLIGKRKNPWKELYEPSRVNINSLGHFVEENANMVGCMIKDWATSSEVNNIKDIASGEGAIVRRGISKVAVFRDEKDVLHERSAACTHLGCVVQWNSGEKSWDCPCHGSRFDCEGRILNGPAITKLAAVEKLSESKI